MFFLFVLFIYLRTTHLNKSSPVSISDLVLPPQQEQYYEQPPAYNPNPGQHSHAPSSSITHHAKENKDESGSVAKQDE